MTTRRDFLTRMGSAIAAPAVLPLVGCGGQEEDVAPAPDTDASASAGIDTPISVQLYSVRNEIDMDLAGTLRAVREAGFDRVETYNMSDMPAADLRVLLDDAGLSVGSMHAGYERVAGDIGAVAEDAHALGSPWVAVAWIPHEGDFDVDDIDRAIADFTAAGEALKSEGLRFAYHCHGYEFREAEGGGTLFDRFMENTEPGVVDVELDVFWVKWPGADPVALIEKYPGRFPLYHMKDMREGTELGDLSGHAPLETNVPVGMGMIDFPAIVQAAEAQGVEEYIIEYEHTDALISIQQSLEYLKSLEV